MTIAVDKSPANSPRTAPSRRSSGPPRLALVAPCYNEQAVLRLSAGVLSQYIDKLVEQGAAAAGSYIYFIDDGSEDATWSIIEDLSRSDPRVRGLRLARNFGHQGAVLAGMLEVDGDVVISIDADLQDDETCIGRMLEEHRAGADVVYGVRNDRTSDNFAKRLTAEGYYRLLQALGVPVVFNHADYRLLSRRAIDNLREFDETNVFLRGMIPLLGLRTATVTYARRQRAAGESKYPVRKMVALAWQGVTSFSIAPLRIATLIGIVVAVTSVLLGTWALGVRYLGSGVVPGWASTVIPMYFLGGIQLLFLGMIGEYIGKIYLETKRRPRYIVDCKSWLE
jgi:polyisoprenyl-phosphate glycosyltransferase